MLFSVVCYNILKSGPKTSFYNKVENEYWHFKSYRLPNIIAEIEGLAADVVCLQEVTSWKELSVPVSTMGYDGHFKQNTSSEDGCSVLWNRERFFPIHYEHVEFEGIDEVGQMICLEEVKEEGGGEWLIVLNIHVMWGTKEAEGKQMEQVKEIVKKLRKFQSICNALDKNEERKEQKKNDFYPFVFCGDFNGKPSSNIYKWLCKSIDSAYGQVYKAKAKGGGNNTAEYEPEMTTWIGNKKETVDYIFFTKSKIKVEQILEIPAEKQLKEFKIECLPCKQFSSDHFSMMAKFSFL